MKFRLLQLGTTEYGEALRLREGILRRPLGLSLSPTDLSNEASSFHLGGFDDQRLLAVLLLQPLDERTLRMRQVAVAQEHQRLGVGSQLIACAEEFARQQGYKRIEAHARGTAVNFYLRLGYAALGEDFIEQTIPHRLVTKTL